MFHESHCVFFPTRILLFKTTNMFKLGLCYCLRRFTSCSGETVTSYVVLSLHEMSKENSGFIAAASHCHVSCSACQCNDRVWVLFPWMSVSWDEVWLMSDLSWAARRDCCEQLQSDGQQKGSNVPLDAACYQGGTSGTGVWWCALLGYAAAVCPLGNLWAGPKTAGCIPSPSLPAG